MIVIDRNTILKDQQQFHQRCEELRQFIEQQKITENKKEPNVGTTSQRAKT